MTGRSLALTERDKAIVAEVMRFGVITRQQLTRLRLFSSKTRANERLRRLVAAGYLAARRQPLPNGGPRLLYLPGQLATDARETRKRWLDASEPFIAHQLGLVDIRLAFERQTALVRWLSDKDLAALSLGIVPDAYVEYETADLTYCAFIEYDRGTETLGRIERKVRCYVDLARSGRFERLFSRKYFRVLMLTDSPLRLATLSNAASRITDRIIRFCTLPELSHQGVTASIWRRPGVPASESLTGS